MRIRLWGELGFYGPRRRDRLELRLERPTPLADALGLAGIPVPEIAVAGVNGVIVDLHDPAVLVADADRVDVFPPSSGG